MKTGRIIELPRRLETQPIPVVLVNMAMSADGKIASANRVVSAFGSARDEAHLYELRATADAVLCGARTVEIAQTVLGPGPAKYRQLRRRRGLAEYNLRVVASGAGSVRPDAAIFSKHFSPVIVLTTKRAGRRRLEALAEVADVVALCGRQQIAWRTALAWLREEWGVERLLGEGGGKLNAAFLRAGLVREFHLTICPFVFGGRGGPTVADGEPVRRLAEALPLQLRSQRRVGDELFCVFDVLA